MAIYALEAVLFTGRMVNSETEFKEYAGTGEREGATWIGSQYGQTVS